MNSCTSDQTTGIILGACLAVSGLLSYAPQYYTIIKKRSHLGISEVSLFLLNVAGAMLALNSLIFNWYKFDCFQECSFFICVGHLLPFIQIVISWIAVFPLYIVYLTYKIKNLENGRVYGLSYFITYLIVLIIGMAVSLVEKSYNNINFFIYFAEVLGGMSALMGGLAWVPQIIKLIRDSSPGNLSMIMFMLQIPGSIIVILFQAVIYQQDISTWIPYVLSGSQQSIILAMIIYYACRDKRCRGEPLQVLNIDEDQDDRIDKNDADSMISAMQTTDIDEIS